MYTNNYTGKHWQLSVGYPLLQAALKALQERLASGESITSAQAGAESAKAAADSAQQQLQEIGSHKAATVADNHHLAARVQDLERAYANLSTSLATQASTRSQLDNAISDLQRALLDVADHTDMAAEELEMLMKALMGRLSMLGRHQQSASVHIKHAADGFDQSMATVSTVSTVESAAVIPNLAMAPQTSSTQPLSAIVSEANAASDVLESADRILAQAEQLLAASADAVQSQPNLAADAMTVEPEQPGAAYESQLDVSSLEHLPSQQTFSEKALEASSKLQDVPELLTPSTAQGNSQEAMSLIDRWAKQAARATLKDSIAAGPATVFIGPVAGPSQVAAVFSNLPDIPDVEAFLQSLISAGSNQAAMEHQSQSGTGSAANEQLDMPMRQWLQHWSSIQGWATKAAWLQQWAHEQHSKAAATISEAADASSRVEAQGREQVERLRSEVLSALGLVTGFAANWWEEWSGQQGLHDGIPAHGSPRKQQLIEPEAMSEPEYSGDGSGKDHGAGGNMGKQNPGNGSSNSDSQPGSGGGGGDTGGGGGGGGGKKPPPGGGGAFNPWDHFDDFSPPGGLDPFVVLPVAIAAATSLLSNLLGNTGADEVHPEQHGDTYGLSQDTTRQQPMTASNQGAALQRAAAVSEYSSRLAGSGGHVKQHKRKQHTKRSSVDPLLATMHSLGTVHDQSTSMGAVYDESGALLSLHDPALDQAILGWQHIHPEVQINASASDGRSRRSRKGKQGKQSPRMQTTALTDSAETADHIQPELSHLSWQELEDLPLPVRQEVLMLRKQVRSNHHTQRSLQQQLATLTGTLSNRDKELAESAGHIAALEAELACLRAEHRQLNGILIDEDVVGAGSGLQGKDHSSKVYLAHISKLTKDAASDRTQYAVHLSQLQAALDALQSSSAQHVAELESRLAGMVIAKGKSHMKFQSVVADLQAQLKASSDKVCELEADAEVSAGTMNQLTDRLAEAEDRNRHQQSAIQELSEELDELRRLLVQQNADYELLESELASARVSASTQASELQAHVQQLQGRAVSKEVQQQPDMIEQLQSEVKQLSTALQRLQDESAQPIHELEQQLSAAQDELLTWSTRAAALEADNQLLQQQLKSTVQGKAAAVQDITALTEELNGLRQGYDPFIATLEDELAAARAESARHVAQLEQDLELTRAGSTALESKVTALLSELQTRSLQLESDKDAAAAREADLQHQLAANAAAVGTLEAQVKELQAAKQKLLDHVQLAEQQSAQQASALEAGLQQLHEQQQAAILECKELQDRLTAQSTESAARIADLEGQVSRLQATCAQLHAQLEVVGAEGGEATAVLQHQFDGERADFVQQVNSSGIPDCDEMVNGTI